jgi:hypothetical protein
MRIESQPWLRNQTCGNRERKGRRTVAKVIEFYIPKKFRKSPKWVSAGKIIEFTLPVKKSVFGARL